MDQRDIGRSLAALSAVEVLRSRVVSWGAAVVAAWGLCALGGVAHADEPADATALRTAGEALAKERRYTEAIDKFKAADRIRPRAAHACLIALAYARRELWPQAEVFLDVCHQRAAVGDPLPPWVAAEDKEIAQRLATANVAPVTLVVTPPQPRATLTVSSFAPDEEFAPRTIHLAPGQFIVVVHVPGARDVSKTFAVASRAPLQVEIELRPAAAPDPGPPVARPPPNLEAPPPVHAHSAPPHHAHALSYAIGGTGVALLALGLVYQETVFASAYDDLRAATSQPDYTSHEKKWEFREHVTQSIYGLGAVAVVAGVALRFTVERDTAVTIQPQPGGGVIGLAWSR